MNDLMPGLSAVPNVHPLFVHFPITLWTVALGFCAFGLGACAGASQTPAQSTPRPTAEEPAIILPEATEPDAAAPSGPTTATGSPSTSEAPDGGVGSAPTGPAAQDLLAAERAAYDRARPVFERHCAKCHTSGGPRATRGALRHFSIDAYPFGGHHSAEIAATIRQVLGVAGKKATMPRGNPGVVQGEELSLIVNWAAAFERSHAAGLHGADHGQHEPDHGHEADPGHAH